MGLGKGRISGGSFAEMITAVTHPHQHGGKANSSFAAPAVNVNESLFFFLLHKTQIGRSAAYAFETLLKLNWLYRGVGNLLGTGFHSICKIN